MNSTTAGTAAATLSAAFPTWSDTLRDGTPVRIRPIGKDDKEAAENAGMHDLAGHLGFYCRRGPDNATQVIHKLRL